MIGSEKTFIGSLELCIWNLHLVLCEQIFLWLAVSGEVKKIGKRYCQDQALPVLLAASCSPTLY